MQVHGSTVIGVATANLIKDVIVRAQDNSNGHKSTGGSSDSYKKQKSKISGKEGAKNAPHWAKGRPPKTWVRTGDFIK